METKHQLSSSTDIGFSVSSEEDLLNTRIRNSARFVLGLLCGCAILLIVVASTSIFLTRDKTVGGMDGTSRPHLVDDTKWKKSSNVRFWNQKAQQFPRKVHLGAYVFPAAPLEVKSSCGLAPAGFGFVGSTPDFFVVDGSDTPIRPYFWDCTNVETFADCGCVRSFVPSSAYNTLHCPPQTWNLHFKLVGPVVPEGIYEVDKTCTLNFLPSATGNKLLVYLDFIGVHRLDTITYDGSSWGYRINGIGVTPDFVLTGDCASAVYSLTEPSIGIFTYTLTRN